MPVRERTGRGVGDGRQGPRLRSGKSMSAMHGLFGGGICEPQHCCSLDIELGRLRQGGGWVLLTNPPQHYKCVCAHGAHRNTHTHTLWVNNSSLPTHTKPPHSLPPPPPPPPSPTPTSLRLCFILTVNTWPKQEPLSICEL